MIGKPEAEARILYERYDRELPFVSLLAARCTQAARAQGYLTLYDGARRHWTDWVAAVGKWEKGAGPCPREEALHRVNDPGHPWYQQRLWRADTHKAMNALIQGSAARQTKLWMRECWREGIVPLLQMHDALDCSVSSPEIAERVAQLGCDVVQLEVPMRVDVRFGRNWADATHTWAELHGETRSRVEVTDAQERTARESPKIFNDFGSTPIFAQVDSTNEEPKTSPLDEETSPLHICIHCHRDPPDGLERVSAYAGAWMHPDCEEPFIRVRMGEEGIPWENPTAPQPSPPPPPSQDEESVLPPPSPARGNGKGNGYLAPEPDASSRKVAEFIYSNHKAEPCLKVIKYRSARTGMKAFSQQHLENGRWVKGKPDGPAFPYRLPELLAAPQGATAEITEGEEDADNLTRLGLITTTNPGGAGKWTPELGKWLTGFARVNIYEDNDTAGRKHIARVAAALSGIVPDIRVVTFREMPEHSDVSDWLKTGKTREQLLERVEQAPKFLALESVRADEEEIKNLTWVWPGRFALGKIGLLVGLPDVGKGLTLSDIMARITQGGAWPCDEGMAPLGNVILLTAEDDINDTIIPRLLAAGADLIRVTIVKMMRDANGPRMFSLISDLGALRQKVLEVGDVRMIVIDPISSYLGIGKIDSFRATDVRAVLGPLKELAAELDLTILGILHFNKKVDITNVLLRISDSLAFGAAARHVYGIVNDPDNDRRLFVKGKNNLAPMEQKTLAFGVNKREVGTDKQTGAPIHAPYIVWSSEPVDITATEAMQAAAENKSPSARDNAKHFIEMQLSNGPVGSKDIYEAAKENGISLATLRRAAQDLGVNIKKDGPVNEKNEITWRWHLPIKEEDEK